MVSIALSYPKMAKIFKTHQVNRVKKRLRYHLPQLIDYIKNCKRPFKIYCS